MVLNIYLIDKNGHTLGKDLINFSFLVLTEEKYVSHVTGI
jgi:hypothetical protein